MRQTAIARTSGKQQLDGYWEYTVWLALFMVATVGLRIQENVPYLALIRPAALAAYGGGFLILSRSSSEAIRTAFGDQTLRLSLAYFGWMWVTIPFALWTKLGLETALIGLPASLMLIALLLCSPDRKTVRTLVLGFCFAAGVVGVAILLIGSTLGGAEERLTTSGSLDPNDLAALMALSIPFGLGIMRRERGKYRLMGLGLVILCSLVVVRTVSRGGTLAMVVGALLYTLGLPGTRKFIAMGALCIASLIGWQLASQPFRDRMQSLTSVEEDYNYTAYAGRKQIWARGRGYIKSHPIFGVGAGNFEVAEGGYAAELGRPAKWSAPHNAYLQAYAELGLFGGSLFVGILVVTGRRAWRMWRAVPSLPPEYHRPELFAALGAFSASAYFLSHAYFYPLFAICGVIALTDRTRVAESIRGRAGAKPTTTLRSGWRTAVISPQVARRRVTSA